MKISRNKKISGVIFAAMILILVAIVLTPSLSSCEGRNGYGYGYCDLTFDRHICDRDFEIFNGYGYGYCPVTFNGFEGEESSNFFLSIIDSIMDLF